MPKRFLCYATVSMFLLCAFSLQARALPKLESTAIIAVDGSDADQDGYYETFTFELELHATGEAASSYDVAARIYCAATDQGWYTESWNVTLSYPPPSWASIASTCSTLICTLPVNCPWSAQSSTVSS